MMVEMAYLHAVIYLQHNLINRMKLEPKRLAMKDIWETGKCVSMSFRMATCGDYQDYYNFILVV